MTKESSSTMSTISRETRTVSAVVVGNPNTGKTTLFNALTGLRHRVGNYPGVTVETKTGQVRVGDTLLRLTDVPGTYSLAPRSLDEMLAVEILLGLRKEVARPDVVLCILDASNLERNLYLATQVMELGLPMVIALNMTDVAAANGMEIDLPALTRRLGVPVLSIQANRKRGIRELTQALIEAAGAAPPTDGPVFPAAFDEEVQRLTDLLKERGRPLPTYLVERALLDVGGFSETRVIEAAGPSARAELSGARERLAAAGSTVPAIEARVRYGWISERLRDVVRRPAVRPATTSDRIDAVLLHRFWGVVVFAVVMTLVFQSIFSWGQPLMDFIDGQFGELGALLSRQMAEGPLRDLLVDGIIAGVGGVLVFLPQIVILFGFIAILEDCGYMARAAFLMDKLMARCGLSGKSFIPMLSSFACAIPGVMATRTIEDRRDRLATILVAPLMSCSARLVVYVLLISAFIPAVSLAQLPAVSASLSALPAWLGDSLGWVAGWFRLQSLVLLSMYLIGMVAAPLVALALKKTLLRGDAPVFLMELPSYKWPAIGTVLYRMLERGWAFIRRAGTLILATTVLIWALQYYPRPADLAVPYQEQRAAAEQMENGEAREEQLQKIEREEAAAYQEQSYLGRIGRTIEPVVQPLGWDWRIGMAAVASFPAREVVVSALGTIYQVGNDAADDDDGSNRLQEALRSATWPDGRPVFTIPVALSLMVFFALCSQCAATLAVIRRETNSWRWPIFTFVYMTLLAYVAALAVYQIGTRLAA